MHNKNPPSEDFGNCFLFRFHGGQLVAVHVTPFFETVQRLLTTTDQCEIHDAG